LENKGFAPEVLSEYVAVQISAQKMARKMADSASWV
jgi:hypothetical protein